MKTKLLALIAGVFFLAQLSPADAAQTAFGVTVKQIVVNGDGSFDAQFSNVICNDSGAQAKDWGQARIGTNGVTSDGVKAMLSSLQAARLSGSTVIIRTTGFVWGCSISAVELH